MHLPLPYILEQLAIGISTGALYAVVALGFNLIFGILNVLNLAYGATMMVGAYGLLLAFYIGIGDFWLAAALGVLFAVLTGLLVERVAVRPLRGNWWNIKVATIGFAMFLENFVTRLTDGRQQAFPRPFEIKYYSIMGLFEIANIQVLLLLFALGLMVSMLLFLRYTKLGNAIRVTAQSPEIAQCLGIDVKRVTIATFAVSGILAGFGGILNAATFSSVYPFVGQALGLKAIVILIVAGLGNTRGCLVVGVILGILESLAVGMGGSTYRDLVAYGGMVAILILKPHGLFGEVGRIGRVV